MAKKKNVYDLVIVGAGISGVFALNQVLKDNKSLKICVIEFGRIWAKRRKQLEGFMGSSFQSGGRLYLSNFNDVSKISTKEITTKAELDVLEILAAHGELVKATNTQPSKEVIDKLDKLGYTLSLNNYIQWYPSNFHLLSRTISSKLEDREDIDFMFDTEVFTIEKDKKIFTLTTENGTIHAKNVLLSVGRSGWRFTKDIFYQFNLVKSDDSCVFGFKGEISTSYMKGWNSSHCTIENENFIVGPMSWNGTIVPEDHCDLVIANWRNNENRWNTDKVSFSVYLKGNFKDQGMAQLERLSKLAYIIYDNRVHKEKLRDYVRNCYGTTNVPEYKWIKEEARELEKLIPNFIEKANIHIPDIKIGIPEININQDFSTDIPGLYVTGESAGLYGLYAAMLSGTVFANNFR